MSERLTTIKELKDFRGKACLVQDEPTGEYFVVSSVLFDASIVPLMGAAGETLVFRANSEGDVTDWMEVAGGKNQSREYAMASLTGMLERGQSWSEE